MKPNVDKDVDGIAVYYIPADKRPPARAEPMSIANVTSDALRWPEGTPDQPGRASCPRCGHASLIIGDCGCIGDADRGFAPLNPVCLDAEGTGASFSSIFARALTRKTEN